MSITNTSGTGSTSPLSGFDSSYQLTQATKKNSNQLNQDEFMKLMLTQFKNQDPLKPQDPAEFLTQLAQITSVTGISEMNKSMAQLADATYAAQTLQASTVVGRNVLAPSDHATLAAGDALRGATNLPVATQTGQLQIFDASGILVRNMSLGPHGAGMTDFQWDGLDSAGRAAPAGTYQVVASYNDGTRNVALDTYLSKRVASVSLGGDGQRTEITTQDGEQIALADIKAIY